MGKSGDPEIEVKKRDEQMDFGGNPRLQSSSLPSSARFSFNPESQVNQLLDPDEQQLLAQSGRSGRLSSSNAEDFDNASYR